MQAGCIPAGAQGDAMAPMTTAHDTPAALPALFLSHGSPMIALEDSPAARFLDRLGPVIDATFGRPKAVVITSPHTPARQPLALAARQHGAVHDFGGFPRELYALRYDTPGDLPLSARVAALIGQAGLDGGLAEATGMDHGIWTLLRRMWPQGGIPVVPLALVPNRAPAWQWQLGTALSALAREGVLVIGSGAFTHNLGRYPFGRDASQEPVQPDVRDWQQWITDRVTAQDWSALFDYRRQAPRAAFQHPTDEHWLPFYVAAGAGAGPEATAVPAHRLHDSVDAGVLAMDGWAFGTGADRLAEALAA